MDQIIHNLQTSAYTLQSWLHQPRKVFLACLVGLVVTFFLNGTLWKLWGLNHDQQIIIRQIQQSQAQMKVIDTQLKQAIDPVFIEHQARDKMDLVGENDLIFVFPE